MKTRMPSIVGTGGVSGFTILPVPFTAVFPGRSVATYQVIVNGLLYRCRKDLRRQFRPHCEGDPPSLVAERLNIPNPAPFELARIAGLLFRPCSGHPVFQAEALFASFVLSIEDIDFTRCNRKLKDPARDLAKSSFMNVH
jgi:hypothetical protein